MRSHPSGVSAETRCQEERDCPEGRLRVDLSHRLGEDLSTKSKNGGTCGGWGLGLARD